MLRIRELRQNKKIMQKELATALNIPANTFNQYETGKREPDYSTLNCIADYFDVSVDYLLGRDENKQKKIRSSEDERTLELLAEYPEVGEIVDIMARLPLSAQKELAEFAKFRADQLEKEHHE